jgi:AraC-like DNA-binding protein
MELPDNFAAVSRMQHYIEAHLDETITLDDIAVAAGYSKFHAERIFKELLHKTPLEYARALRLTSAAQTLQDSGDKIIDIALDSGFNSHDGFTRAFARQFGITPQKYQTETPPVGWLVGHPIEAYYQLKEGTELMEKEKVSRTVTVSVIERPARKLIFLRTPGKGYFEDCAVVGCDWEGYFKSIPERMTNGAGGRLPTLLGGGTAFFVEVPSDYDKQLPNGYEIADLSPCTYLYFCGMPFDDQNDFPIAIGIMNEAVENYPFERMGWKKSDNAPDMGLGAEAETGAQAYVPVERI